MKSFKSWVLETKSYKIPPSFNKLGWTGKLAKNPKPPMLKREGKVPLVKLTEWYNNIILLNVSGGGGQ
jgi:hypothetical protein